MPSQAAPPPAYRFDDRIEVRPAQRELLVDGQPAPLGARAFDLLLALIEHRDRVVPKHELLDLVWPGLVVEENNLQVQVSTLRKLLGPKAIATVPGRGYRCTLAPEATPRVAPAAPRAGLAAPPVALVGRDGDLQALLALLDAHRLVTLVGPGGIGKTSLARCAAQARTQAWPDGVAWVELASLTDGRLIAGTLAQALDLQITPGSDALAALLGALGPLQLLLVIDNAEHLLEALAPVVDAIAQAATGVHLLVTSQAPLRVHGEQVLRLEALAVPEPGSTAQEAAAHGAVALFTGRARAADRHFTLGDDNVAHVIEICRRLDGLPLALELAAARVPLLGARGVAERLDDRFRLLAGGIRSAPTRQQTLQATLEWSLALLPEKQREVFHLLGVFAGGFPLQLACDVLTGDELDEWTLIDTLAALADHSLLSVGRGDAPRYALGETARAYALTRPLPAPLHDRHAAAVRRFFDDAPADWLKMPDAQWLARYAPELDNLRAALRRAHAAGDRTTVVSLVGAAAPLWHHLSLHAEAREWHELSEPLLGEHLDGALAARWWRAAQWAWAEVSPERCRAAAERAHALYRALGDVHGLYAELTGLAGLWREPDPRATAALEEALSLEDPSWPPRERAWGQRARADVARAQGWLEESLQARLAEIRLRCEAGDERGELRARLHLADLETALGRHAQAVQHAEDVVTSLRRQRAPALLRAALATLATAVRAGGDEQRARTIEREAAN